jgi:hypothetical protein
MRMRLCAWMWAGACAASQAQGLAGDPEAVRQLVGAASLDAMTEASVQACGDVGAPSYPQLLAAWVAWRERHRIAPLRTIVMALKQRHSSSSPPWSSITEPMRQRVLAEAAPDKACAALIQDLQGPGMDASAQFPQASATAAALVQAKMAVAPTLPALAPGTPRGQVLLPAQMPALKAQQGGGWTAISREEAARRLGPVHVKGRVERWGRDGDRFHLAQEQGDRRARHTVNLDFNAEAWLGREIVVRGVLTSLATYSSSLGEAALVSDASGLTPSPLAAEPLGRKEVLLQRVTRAPGKGLAGGELAAIVIHGESNFSNGTQWEEDVRFLLRDGTTYRRTEMPPDQLNVPASRQLEPQQWGRWRAAGKSYEMQAQDDDGRPDGPWKAEKHHAVRPWPAGTRLDGSYSRGSFHGSLALGGTSFKNAIRFTKDGRFERSHSSLSSSGSVAATLNNAVISASSHGDGSGSSSTGGGTVGGPFGTVGAGSTRKADDGASRRGRYELNGFVLSLHYDDGRQERLLSFPVWGDHKTVYVGNGSLSLDDR